MGLTRNKFNNDAARTIKRNVRLAYHTCIYHITNFLSSGVSIGSESKLFFISGAKNIIPAIAELIA